MFFTFKNKDFKKKDGEIAIVSVYLESNPVVVQTVVMEKEI